MTVEACIRPPELNVLILIYIRHDLAQDYAQVGMQVLNWKAAMVAPKTSLAPDFWHCHCTQSCHGWWCGCLWASKWHQHYCNLCQTPQQGLNQSHGGDDSDGRYSWDVCVFTSYLSPRYIMYQMSPNPKTAPKPTAVQPHISINNMQMGML